MHIQKLSISNWKEYISASLFRQSDGFCEIPYLSNSGDIMKESLTLLDPSSHNPAYQSISCDNEMLCAFIRYQEVDKGLWVFATEMDVKQNIMSRTLYDEAKISNYYFLSFAVFKYYYPVDSINQSFVPICSITNTFYKPKTKVTNYFYKGSNGLFFNIGFTKEWAQENLKLPENVYKKMNDFLNQRPGLINWMEVMPDSALIVEKIWKLISEDQDKAGDGLYTTINQTISQFFNAAMSDTRIDDNIVLQENDYAKLAKAEQIILSNLNKPFVGVNFIADLVEMSATKLKFSFKLVFGYSMLQYHRERNMRLAYQILQNSETQIKYVTELVGFNSVSKFSAAFKKRFAILPSSVRKKSGCS